MMFRPSDSLATRVGHVQYALLKQFLGVNERDAISRAAAWSRWAGSPRSEPGSFPVPAGLQRSTIDAYERLSDQMIKLGRDDRSTQRFRQEMCEAAMAVLDAQGRDSF